MRVLLVVCLFVSFSGSLSNDFCEITACEVIETFRTELDEHTSKLSSNFTTEEYQLTKLERRVRSLEQPIWQISTSENRWLDCTKGACKCRPETKSLSCWSHNISILPTGQIVPADIISIDLGINSLTTLHKNSFRGLNDITEIDLFNNQIDFLPHNILEDLMELLYLRLHKNFIEELSDELFASLTNLKTLDISYNRIRYLPAGAFRNCVKLVVLHLSGNKIGEIPEHLFDGLVLLEDLDLSGNNLSHLKNPSFSDLVNLKKLKLSENKISNIDSGIFGKLISLEHLNLRKNDLAVITAEFSNLVNLTVLELSINKIVKIQPGSFQLNQLRELHLQQNIIYELPENIFIHTKNLEKLFLYSNNLEQLKQRSFNGLFNLTSLLLNNNLLVTFHPGVFSFVPKLQRLHLDSNRFRFLPPKSLDMLHNLQSIKLTKNPWHCDCNLMYLSGWISKNSYKLWGSQPTCKGPGDLGGAELSSMNFDTLCHGQWASMINLAARIPVRQPLLTPSPIT